jgi:lysophospholipase
LNAALTPAEAAPLLALPEAPVPAGGSAQWFIGAGGRRLRVAYFPAENPVGSVMLSTGRTEAIEKYLEVVGELLARGFSVLVHDWRGQGLSDRLLSDRLKGHAVGFDDFVADFGALLTAFDDRLPHPRIAMAHSMGGCLVLLALARGEKRFDGAVLSAPMLGIKTGANPYWLARALAWGASLLGAGGGYVLGQVTDPFTATFDGDRMTHDRARHDRSRAQILASRDLALGNVTWGWARSAFAAVDWLRSARAVTQVAIPVTVVAAGADTLVDNAALKAITQRLPHGRFVEIPGAYHEILMETDDIRAVFWGEFDALAARA